MSLLGRIAGIGIGLFVAWWIATTWGNGRYNQGKVEERLVWQGEVVKAERSRLAAFQAGLAERDAASTVYRETIRTLPPITNTIIERTTEYAGTPAGAAQCLPADRVQLIAETRNALFAASPDAAPARGP